MKTTIEISDPLLAAAKAEARRRGTSLRALVEKGLAAVLARPPLRKGRTFRLRSASVGGNGLQAEFRGAPWATIRDHAYGVEMAEQPGES